MEPTRIMVLVVEGKAGPPGTRIAGCRVALLTAPEAASAPRALEGQLQGRALGPSGYLGWVGGWS